MRRYWIISLAIGGCVSSVVLALHLGGVFEPLSERLWQAGVSRGWVPSGEVPRLRHFEIPAIALAGLATAWGIVEVTRPVQKLLVAALSIAAAALLAPAWALHGFRFDSLAPVLAAALAAAGGFLVARTEFGKRKRLLEEALGTRVSAGLFAELLEAPADSGLSGERREVTTLVCRLFVPEEFRDRAGPVDLLKASSLFVRSVSAFLMSRGAYLEEAGPERIRASFGMLRAEEDHAEKACRAALDLRGRLKGLSQECEARWFLPLRCGIGIGSGTMAVGRCGTPGNVVVAGLGGEGDFADRLALANARLGSDLLLGPGTYRLVQKRFEVRPLELLYDPMRRSLSEIYQLLGVAESLDGVELARKEAFWRGVVHLRAGDCEAALAEFGRAKVPGVEDLPLALLVDKAQEGVAPPESRAARLVREFTEEGRARLIQQL